MKQVQVKELWKQFNDEYKKNLLNTCLFTIFQFLDKVQESEVTLILISCSFLDLFCKLKISMRNVYADSWLVKAMMGSSWAESKGIKT